MTKWSWTAGPSEQPTSAGCSGPGLRRALAALCITEITSWGALYYAFPVLLQQLTRATGWRPGTALGAFSMGMVVSAVAGVPVGRLLNRYGPRVVMTSGSLGGVTALLAVAAAPTLAWFFTAWALAGVAQSALLYPPAFAALTRWYGPSRIRAMTVLSLAAGLSSTLFAPLTAALVGLLGWRVTYVALAALLGVITLPLHALCLTPAWPAEDPDPQPQHGTGHIRAVLRYRAFWFLLAATALGALGLYAAIADLVPLLTSEGTSNTFAAIALGLVGAGQLLGRLGYATLTRRTSPRTRAIVILAAGSVTVTLLAVVSRQSAALLTAAILTGAVRGSYTLLQATAISDRWGTRHYPALNGIYSAPATLAIAIAPAGGAWLAGRTGSYTSVFCVLAVLILLGAVGAARTQVLPEPSGDHRSPRRTARGWCHRAGPRGRPQHPNTTAEMAAK
jgi:MFS family permease